jgi:rhodanese-related sulfurtransferase
MKRKLTYFFVLGLFATAFGQGKAFKDFTAEEFKSKIDTKDANGIILDVRTPDEISTGVIPGAIFLDYFQKDFEKQVTKLDPSKTYLVYCASGLRSGETVQLMKKNGFKEAHNLKGGLASWKKSNLPIQMPKK